MITEFRTQIDGRQDELSDATATIPKGPKDVEDVTRQEFRDEADINVLLKRYGVGSGPPLRDPIYGEVDYDLDLMGAYTAVRQAREAFQRLPQDVREAYPSWDQLLAGIGAGAVIVDETGTAQLKVETPAETPPANPA